MKKSKNDKLKTTTTLKTDKQKKLKISRTNILLHILFLSILFVAFICSLLNSVLIIKNEEIKYSEKSKIDYQVYLKDNDFYNTPYLNKGMAYVANLIDKIDIKYNYVFNSNKKSDVNFKYKIIAKLIIASQNNDKIFYQKDYELKKEELNTIKDKNNHVIDEIVSIDYNKYNSIVNKFRTSYAVDTTSRLEVALQVSEKSKNTNNYSLNNQNKTVLTIPLSQQEINVGLDEKVVNNHKKANIGSKIVMGKRIYIYSDLMIFVIIIIVLIAFIRKLRKYNNNISNYDKYVNKILRGYDRLIVNVQTPPVLEDYNVIKVESLEELIDLRDNTKEPIRYLVIEKHKKGLFFLTNHNDLYIYRVNDKDLNKKKK